MTKSEQAKNYFNQNYNCCQAVLAAFCEDLGLDKATALKMTTGMGGGMKNGKVCGAVSGGTMVLGLKYGIDGTETTDNQKMKCHHLTKAFTDQFKETNGDIDCKGLLGYDVTVPEDMEVIREKGLFTTMCPAFVESAAIIVETIMNDN